MKLDHLRYFLEVSHCRSLSQAAGRLFISQQGLNKAMASLESEFGVKLLDRSPQGTELTTEGKLLADFTTRCMDDLSQTLVKMNARNTSGPLPKDSSIKLTATNYGLSLVAFRFEHPCVKSAHEVTYDEALAQLSDKGFPGIALIDVFNDTSIDKGDEHLGFDREEFEVVTLLSTSLGLLVGPNHELYGKRKISTEQLCNLELAAIRDETIRNVCKRITGGKGLQALSFETTNSQMLLSCITEKGLSGLLDSFAYWNLVQEKAIDNRISFVAVDTPLIDTVCFVYRKESPDAYINGIYADWVKRGILASSAEYFKQFRLQR